MAFTKTPSVSTYSTERQHFLYNPLTRTGNLLNKDARLVNMLIEINQHPDTSSIKTFVKSRPGLTQVYATAAGEARGVYYWIVSGVGYAISVTGDKVYSNSTLLQTITTSTGTVGFTEFVDSTGAVKLVLVDGTKGYVFTSPTVAGTEITSVDFPTPHCPSPIFMDGYLFLAKAGTQDIYNSNLDDPALWTAGDYISAEMYPDKIVALSKNNNYIYALGNNSIEYFYDAANATASPLGRHDSAVQQFGAVAASTVVSTDNEVVLVGETGNGGHTVWTVSGFKENEIATPAIRSIFRAEGNALSSANAYCIRVSGQKLYVICLTSVTLVYSFDSKMWTMWNSGATSANAFIGKRAHDGPNGEALVQEAATGNIDSISEVAFTDNGTAFQRIIITPKFDWDSLNRKTMSRLGLIGDIPTSSGTGNTITVYWSDDDYQNWSAGRTLSFDYDFPVISQLGSFRRRAFKFVYSQPYFLRLEGFEVDINKGTS